MLALGVLLGLWNNGTLFPSWVQWRSFSMQTDVNGNAQQETVSLGNRHLTITDHYGNEYITPDSWMVADARLGDITGDGTPEIIVLTWEANSNPDQATFVLPLLGQRSGFNQYLHVLDYQDGEALYIWDSSPLNFAAREIAMGGEGTIRIDLSSGTVTYWRWQNPGFLLQDEEIPANIATRLR